MTKKVFKSKNQVIYSGVQKFNSDKAEEMQISFRVCLVCMRDRNIVSLTAILSHLDSKEHKLDWLFLLCFFKIKIKQQFLPDWRNLVFQFSITHLWVSLQQYPSKSAERAELKANGSRGSKRGARGARLHFPRRNHRLDTLPWLLAFIRICGLIADNGLSNLISRLIRHLIPDIHNAGHPRTRCRRRRRTANSDPAGLLSGGVPRCCTRPRSIDAA